MAVESKTNQVSADTNVLKETTNNAEGETHCKLNGGAEGEYIIKIVRWTPLPALFSLVSFLALVMFRIT